MHDAADALRKAHVSTAAKTFECANLAAAAPTAFSGLEFSCVVSLLTAQCSLMKFLYIPTLS